MAVLARAERAKETLATNQGLRGISRGGAPLVGSPPHPVDDLVEHARVAGRVARVRVGRAFHPIQPAVAVPVAIDYVDVLLEHGVRLDEPAADHTVQVAAGLEPLEPPDLVAQAHLVSGPDLESDVDDVAEHPRGKLRQPDTPDAGAVLLHPEVRWRIQPIRGQPRGKPGPPVVNLSQAALPVPP